MTPKSLFIIVLKIIGLFILKNFIELIPQLIETIIEVAKPNSYMPSFDETLFMLLWLLIVVAFYGFVCYQLLFKTARIVNLLKLDKGFEQEEFSFDLSNASMLTIGVVVIGGIILTTEIPNLCQSLFLYFQERKTINFSGRKPDTSYLVLETAKIIIGLLLIGERKRVVTFIENGQNKNTEE
jgi:hypothetical protein